MTATTASSIVTALANREISLATVGGQLHTKAPRGAVTPETLALIRRHKSALLASLAAPTMAEEPTGCCPLDGGNHFWLDAAGWRCGDCMPMPDAFTGESLTLSRMTKP